MEEQGRNGSRNADMFIKMVNSKQNPQIQTKVINWNISPFPRNSLLTSHMPCLLVVLKRTYRKAIPMLVLQLVQRVLALPITYAFCTTNLHVVFMSADILFACLSNTK